MEKPTNYQRTYHGEIDIEDVAAALIAEFNQGNLVAQKVGTGDKIMVQIASRQYAQSGGKTALSITVQKVEDGVSVAVGQQEWLGVAASLGKTALSTIMNPWNLLGRLDDIAQDVSALQLTDRVWATLEHFAQATKATKTISERLQSLVCPYCHAANKMGAAQCEACGGPLGDAQPVSCAKCGNVLPPKSKFCPNCGTALTS